MTTTIIITNNNTPRKAGATEPGLLRDDAVQTRQRAPSWSATGSLLASFANGHEEYWIVIMLSCTDDNTDAQDQNFDCLQFMDSASEGVLLVSFGSVLQGSQVCCFCFLPNNYFCFCHCFVLFLGLFNNFILHGWFFPLINKNNPDGQVPQDKLAALLEAFGRLKEKVLFKWETDDLPGFTDFESHETFPTSFTYI